MRFLGRRHPVTILKASLIAGSIRRVWVLRHQTGAQFSAVEYTRARVAVRNVVATAPQLEPASHLKSATRDVIFLRNDSRYRRYVSDLSNVTPTYLGSGQKGRIYLYWQAKTWQIHYNQSTEQRCLLVCFPLSMSASECHCHLLMRHEALNQGHI